MLFSHRPFLSHEIRSQLICHVLAYADMLLVWELSERRSELLKLVEAEIQWLSFDAIVADTTLYSAPIGWSFSFRLGVAYYLSWLHTGYRLHCETCGHHGEPGITTCVACAGRIPARCSVCRLTIKGTYSVPGHVQLTHLHPRPLPCMFEMSSCQPHEVLESTGRPVLCDGMRLRVPPSCV